MTSNETCNTEKLRERKQILIDYLLSSVAIEDWHAVQDAASDIREIEAKLSVMLSKH
jgi:hypothetical protein